MALKSVRPGVRVALGALLLGAIATPAAAQQVDSLRRAMLIALPPTIAIQSLSGSISPGSSAASPTAFGANFGDGFVGVGYQQRTRFTEKQDGSAVVGVGLGNSRDLIGLEVSFTTFSTVRSRFLSELGASFKLHRVLPGNWGVAAGAENVLQKNIDSDKTYYGVVSKVWGQSWWNPFNTVTTSVGVGNGRFRSENDVSRDKKTANVFGNIGVQLFQPVSAIADWNGQDLTLAASIVPFRGIPLIITPGIADITGRAGDGARFTVGAGMGFDFAKLPRIFP
jgi:hypothetical protein